MQNLVKITEEKFNVILDIRYASTNNVCKKKIYSTPFCYLHEDAIAPLEKAIKYAGNLGLKIKIFDAFRPIQAQKFMFNRFNFDKKNDGFISNPQTGSIPHCRGVAIDLTLIDEFGQELDMGSDFDEFSSLAFHNSSQPDIKAQKNRLILLGLMTTAGWDYFSKEWWHYQLFEPRKYQILEVKNNIIEDSVIKQIPANDK